MQRKTILWVVCALTAVMAFGWAGTHLFDDQVELYYRRPSWEVDSVLPLELPPAARNIRMIYNVKHQLGFGVCDLTGEAQARMAASLNPVPSEEMVYLASDTATMMKRTPSWWPQGMLDRISEGEMMFLRSQHYFYAVGEGQVFFWTKTAPDRTGLRS